MRSPLFVIHRWFGIPLCVVLALWFATGIVMIYVGYPQLTREEQLSHRGTLDPEDCCIPLSEAWAALPPGFEASSVTLANYAGRDIYRIEGEGRVIPISAESGERVSANSESFALQSARSFMPGVSADYRELLEADIWTRGNRLNKYRPLHVVQLGDEESTLLYISSTTGETIRDATLMERRLNFIGPWLHWLHVFRAAEGAWKTIIVAICALSVFLVVTGMIIGTQKWKFRGRYRSGSRTPYREFHLRWHHITGMIFSLVAVTWLFSGAMSVNPLGMFRSSAPPLDRDAYAGRALEPEAFAVEAGDVLRNLTPGFDAREMEWRVVGGRPYLLAYDATGDVAVHHASADRQERVAQLTMDEIVEPARLLVPGSRVTDVSRLNRYDFYYYARAEHTLYGNLERPLPVLKVTFDDPDNTTVYLDPKTGKIVGQYNRAERMNRWLFRLLHSWDFAGLLSVRPAWDVLVIVGCLGGLFLSVTGFKLASRHLKRTVPKALKNR